MKEGNTYSPSRYAKGKGVKPPRITKLKDQLVKKEFGGKWFVVHCEENDKLFDNPAHNRGGKEEEER